MEREMKIATTSTQTTPPPEKKLLITPGENINPVPEYGLLTTTL
jgi:hypothetical protein